MAGSSSAEEPHSSGGEQPAEASLGNAAASSYAQQNPPPACDLQLPLSSSRLESKPAEVHEQKKIIMTGYNPPVHSVSRVHRPVATQPDQATAAAPAAAGGGGGGGPPQPGGGGGGGPPPGGFSMPLHNSVFQGSAPTQLSGFAPFPYTADHSLRPPQMQQLTAAQAASAQGHINIGVTIPVKSVPAVTAPATIVVNPFNGVDANQCTNDARDKGIDNAFVVTINERRVRLSNTGSDSLYALCRRWIRNDIPRKDQHVPWDSVRPLPRPLSGGVAESSKDKSTEDAKEKGTKIEIGSELEEPLENISEHQLLQAHVKHAKTVRARLRAERMQRIGRFKQRLALLLPSSMDQNKSNSVVPS